MFSTMLGPLPRPALGDAGDGNVGPTTIRALEDAGLELLASGEPPLDPSTSAADAVAAWERVAGLTDRPVKQAILGPYAGGGAAAAERLAPIVTALASAGCPIVEVVEPDLSPIVTSPAERDRFVDAHRSLFGALGTLEPGTHCSLVAGGGNLDTAGPAVFFDLSYPSYAFDLIDGPDNWRLIAAAPSDRGIVCGALAARVGGDETREVLVWAAQYAASTGGRGLDRVGLANAGSLADLPWDVALRKLRRVAEAARIASSASSDAVGAQLDPRAFGGRRARPRSRAVSSDAPAERAAPEAPDAPDAG